MNINVWMHCCFNIDVMQFSNVIQKQKKRKEKKKDNEKKTYAICDYPNTKRNVTFASIKYFI